MMQKLALLFGLVASATCMVLHQPPFPITYRLQYEDVPNYNFAYEVNDARTGDIKSQHESRRGESVLGQYSLLQPDGVRRTVDYRADELEGFRATVNNEAGPIQEDKSSQENSEPRETTPANAANYIWPAPTPSSTPAPAVAISRSSIVQTFSHGNNNPWY